MVSSWDRYRISKALSKEASVAPIMISNSIYDLYYQLQLTRFYCSNNNVILCLDKTQLHVYLNGDIPDEVLALEAINPIHINGQLIPLFKNAEHLGVI